jgi:hypothetical protein
VDLTGSGTVERVISAAQDYEQNRYWGAPTYEVPSPGSQWVGADRGDGSINQEEVKPNPAKADTAPWDAYLGTSEPWSDHPATRDRFDNRLWGNDWFKSIRMGYHEFDQSTWNNAHYHFETWVYFNGTDAMVLKSNTKQNIVVPRKGW